MLHMCPSAGPGPNFNCSKTVDSEWTKEVQVEQKNPLSIWEQIPADYIQDKKKLKSTAM